MSDVRPIQAQVLPNADRVCAIAASPVKMVLLPYGVTPYQLAETV